MMRKNRITIQKCIINDAVMAMKNHPTADSIYRAVRTNYPHISKGTVYRNLQSLALEGKIKRIEIPNASDRYDFNTTSHHHLKCRICNGVYDVNGIDFDLLTISSPHQIESYDIIFTGICNNCFKKEKEKI